MRNPGGGRGGQRVRVEPDAGVQYQVAGAEVLARVPDVAAALDDGVDPDAALDGRGLLDGHDGVRARGEGGAGHDLHAGAAAEDRVLRRAGEHFAGDVQGDAGYEVGGAHGVAVHGGVGESGHVAARQHGLGQRAAGRLAQGHALDVGKGRDEGQHLG